jgi:Flp pilus assembly protein TadG
MPVRSRKPAIRSQRGETLVEFAFASIVFFATIFGTLWFGLAVWQYNLLANLAQEGARRASVCGAGTSLTSTQCNIQLFVSSRALGMTVTATPTPTDLTTLSAGDSVMVTVQKSFTPGTSLIPSATLSLQASARMIVAR